MSNTPNPIVVAAVPSLLAVIAALNQFFANIGTDPVQISAKLPGAAKVLLGTIEMQLPGLAASEVGALEAEINTKLASWATSLKALQVQPAQVDQAEAATA